MTTREDMSSEDAVREKLEREGFGDIQIVKLKQNTDLGNHVHDKHTVHVVLLGELIISSDIGTQTHRRGERVEFPAGTVHGVKTGSKGLVMVVGSK